MELVLSLRGHVTSVISRCSIGVVVFCVQAYLLGHSVSNAEQLSSFSLGSKYSETPEGYFLTINQEEARAFYEQSNRLSRSQMDAWVDFPAGSESALVCMPDSIAPEKGYGLYVYIGASNSASFPAGYDSVFDELGIIGVALRNAGNSVPEPGRFARALDAVRSVMAAYDIDPQRVYVGGHSGGGAMAILAMHLYPQVFQGALSSCRAVDFPKEAGFLKYDEVAVAGNELGHRTAFVTGPLDFNYNHVFEKYQYGGSGLPISFFDDPEMGHELPSITYFRKALKWLDAGYQSTLETSYADWERVVFDRSPALPWFRTPEADPDDDGLTNMEEFTQGTNPTRFTRDRGHGMLTTHAQGWRLEKREHLQQLEPFVRTSGDLVAWDDYSEHLEGLDLSFDWDALETPRAFFRFGFTDSSRDSNRTHSDRDGLSDADESIFGTDPSQADTDGDTLSDAFELKYRLNPQGSVDMELIETIRPMDVVEYVFGGWMNFWPDSDQLRTVSTRSKIRYQFVAPERGYYVVQVSGYGTRTNFPADMSNLERYDELRLSIGEHELGSGTLRPGLGSVVQPAVYQGSTVKDTLSFMSPRLDAGRHDLFVTHFDETTDYPKVTMSEIRIYQVHEADWDWRLETEYRELSQPYSYCSPTIFEFEARYPGDFRINGNAPETIGPEKGFLPLELDPEAIVTDCILQIANYSIHAGVVWEAFDLASGPDSLVVRRGSTVKFTQDQWETAIFRVNGLEVGFLPSGGELLYTFYETGSHLVSLQASDSSRIERTITCVDYDFGQEGFALRAGFPRSFTLPELPVGMVLTGSTGLELEIVEATGATQVRLSSEVAGTHYLIARIEDSGEIVDICKVETFVVSWSPLTNRFQSRMTEQNFQGFLVQQNLPSWIRIDLQLMYPDLVFLRRARLTTRGPFGYDYESEETQSKSIWSADFLEFYGEYKFYYGVPYPLRMDYSNCVKGTIFDSRTGTNIGHVLLPHF